LSPVPEPRERGRVPGDGSFAPQEFDRSAELWLSAGPDLESGGALALPSVRLREGAMTLKEIKDKLEVGLKPDAPYRSTNRPESERPHPPHPPGTDPPADDAHDKATRERRRPRPGSGN
jgi:hypothetical protein